MLCIWIRAWRLYQTTKKTLQLKECRSKEETIKNSNKGQGPTLQRKLSAFACKTTKNLLDLLGFLVLWTVFGLLSQYFDDYK